jgi:hypothetical protein
LVNLTPILPLLKPYLNRRARRERGENASFATDKNQMNTVTLPKFRWRAVVKSSLASLEHFGAEIA